MASPMGRRAHIVAREEHYAYHCSNQDLPQLPFPALRFYIQTDGSDVGTKISVNTDPQCNEIKLLARELLSHLAGSQLARLRLLMIFYTIIASPNAGAALAARLGEDRSLNEEDFLFRPARAPQASCFRNLTKLQPPSGLTPARIDEQWRKQRLIWSMTYLYEVIHCMTNFFFLPAVVTPPAGRLQLDDDPGASFEDGNLGHILEVVWRRISRSPRECGTLTAEADIIRIQRSFKKVDIWRFFPQDLAPYTKNEDTHVRYRDGEVSQWVETSEEEDFTPRRNCRV
ncbi:hypothetical protein DFH09DRAFT_1100998 [Mycena vulgaris]|nr:hypothetical protein DFH09DRAFT_1100998 [Mycena vulgaris]